MPDNRIGVGGGASTNTWNGRWILRGPAPGTLPPAAFIRRSGSLACADDQALVAVKVGDLIITGSGRRPAGDPNNPDRQFQVERVTAISPDIEVTPLSTEDMADYEMPASVARALDTYHNRDGSLFVAPEETK